MAALLAILLFGTISINAQIPPPQFPQVGQPQIPQVPQPPVPRPPVPAPPSPPPPGYQGIGCPNAAEPCPRGQYRYDAVTIGTAVYGCFCTCPYTLARDCPVGTMQFNWDTCSCDHTPPPTTPAPTTPAPTTPAPVTPAPTWPRTFPQPGGGGALPPAAPLPGQVLPPWNQQQPGVPPMGGPGPYPIYPGNPLYPGQPGFPAVPQPPPVATKATTWAPGPAPGTLATGAPLDELCGPDPFVVLGFKRVGNKITLEMECRATTTSTTAISTTAASSTATPI